ncbi:acyl-CoA thioesterase [Cereibacter azotoformans]|nr:thioesterase family protein [Cereibacter azotoformans]AXQ95308.1 acyl-CoA thioesterase [Cereibacter sphaeroides]UIJ32467.1 acyl-CoA thioesterase [Cereibacter azotoformans]
MSDRRPAPGLRAGYRAFREHSTRWMDNDAYGHLNNVVHYALFDATVNGWLIEAGLLNPLQGARIGLVVETGCRYHSEMGYPDRITGGLRVAHVGNSSVRYELGLFRNDAETASAEGFFVHVYVDAKTRRPVPLPLEFRAALQELGGPPRD